MFELRDIARQLSPEQFADGFLSSGIASPWNALTEISNKTFHSELPALEISNQNEPFSVARELGKVSGFALDLAVCGYWLREPTNSVLRLAGMKETAAAADTVRLATTGAAYGGLLQKNESDSHLVKGRVKNAIVMGGSFASMGVVGLPADILSGTKLIDVALGNFAAGTVGGASSSILDSVVNGSQFNIMHTIHQSLDMGLSASLFAPVAGLAGSRPRAAIDENGFKTVLDSGKYGRMIKSLRVGEQGWAVGWAVRVTRDGQAALWPEYGVYPEPGGTVNTLIQRVAPDTWRVDTRAAGDYQWYVDRNLRENYPRVSQVVSELPDRVGITRTEGMPKALIQPVIADLKPGQLGYVTSWSDFGDLVSVSPQPRGTLNTPIRRQLDGTLVKGRAA